MAWLDLRPDSKAGKFLANKFVSLFIAVIQLILWVSAFIGILSSIGKSGTVIYLLFLRVYYLLPAGQVAFIIIFILFCIGFSALLIVGIIKDRNGYIKAYLIFIFIMIVNAIFLVVWNLFTQPQGVGVAIYLILIFGSLLHLLFFFVVRKYYLSKTSRTRNVNGV